MDGIFHPAQADGEYCWELLREYGILQTAQIYAILKRHGKMARKNQRFQVVKPLTEGGLVIRQYVDGEQYLCAKPGLAPVGRYLFQIKCFWVLIDYLSQVEFHCANNSFFQIAMTIADREYNIAYVEKGCEKLCGAEMNRGGITRYILVVEDTGQIPLIQGDKVATFATVSDKGCVEYYEGV